MIILFVLTASNGCDADSQKFHWHKKFRWVASDYFQDPKVIELCQAVERSDIPTMQKILESGADVKAKGKGNMTPLLWAFPENRDQAFQLLLKFGADPNVKVTDEFNTRGGICVTDSVTMLAARSAFPNHLGWVLDHGGDPNITSEPFNETPLHGVIRSLASQDVKLHKVKRLINAGANLEHRSVGMTPLIAAGRQPKLLIELLKAGANVEAESDGDMQLAHLLLSMDTSASTDFDTVLQILESKGVSLAEAKKDLERWKSYRGRSPAETKMLMDQDRQRRANLKKSSEGNAARSP
jgi:ankyrin repeat protein